jgi:hypothetical protein
MLGEVISPTQLPAMSATNPDPLALYNQWSANVRAAGGVVINSAGIDVATRLVTVPGNLALAKFPMSVWVPRVNALQWAQPDGYDRTGQYGYYVAPAGVQSGATATGQGTDAEAAKALANQSWWQQLKLALSAMGAPSWLLPAGLALVAIPVVLPLLSGAARAVARTNPPRRRRRYARR